MPWVLFWGFIPCFGMFILELRDFKDDHKEAMRQRKTRHKGWPKQGRIIRKTWMCSCKFERDSRSAFLGGTDISPLGNKRIGAPNLQRSFCFLLKCPNSPYVEEKKVEMARFRPLLVACHHTGSKTNLLSFMTYLPYVTKLKKKTLDPHCQRTFFLQRTIKIKNIYI